MKTLYLELGVGYNTPRYHQVSFLAGGLSEPGGGIRMHQLRGCGGAAGDCGAVDLYRGGHWRGTENKWCGKCIDGYIRVQARFPNADFSRIAFALDAGYNKSSK